MNDEAYYLNKYRPYCKKPHTIRYDENITRPLSMRGRGWSCYCAHVLLQEEALLMGSWCEFAGGLNYQMRLPPSLCPTNTVPIAYNSWHKTYTTLLFLPSFRRHSSNIFNPKQAETEALNPKIRGCLASISLFLSFCAEFLQIAVFKLPV